MLQSEHGVQVHIPVTPEKTAKFHFVFKTDPDCSKRGLATFQEGDVLTFTLTNFLSSLGASLSQPFEFNIGADKYFLQIYGNSSGEDSLCLTISYLEDKRMPRCFSLSPGNKVLAADIKRTLWLP